MTQSSELKRIAAIGECMVELRDLGDGRMERGFGGDTLNTAVYMARQTRGAASVDYVTALGDDPFSDEMLESWQKEGLGTTLIPRLPGRRPGLYIIKTDDSGERSFFYWRGEAAARDLLKDPLGIAALDRLIGYDLVYLSGITLGILDQDSRTRLYALLEQIKGEGGLIAFDGNFRPALWPNLETARAEMEKALRLSDIALPSFDDEANLCGDRSLEETVERLRGLGVREAVVKNGADAGLLLSDGKTSQFQPNKVENVVDTTAAGDSFNGAYLAARMLGTAPLQAVSEGHKLAGHVVTRRGAIVD